MTLQQLRYFVEAYKRQNMSMASRRLSVSQPSISMAIRELEQEFHAALFVRQGKQLIPTEAGNLLYAHAVKLLEETDGLSKVMADALSERKSIDLGITPMINEMILPLVFKTFAFLHPEIRVNAHEQGSGALLKALDNDEIDCALVTHTGPISEDYASIPLSNLEVVLCTHRRDLKNANGSLDIQHFSTIPLTMFRGDFLIPLELKSRLKGSGLTTESLNVFYSDQLSTVKNLILNDIASGFLYKPIAAKLSDVSTYPLDPPLFVQMSLVWKKGMQNNAPLKSFIHFIRKNLEGAM